MQTIGMNLLSALALTGLISGCTTLTAEQIRAQDEATCASYGFKTQSNDFANCLLQLDLSRQADRRAWQQDQRTIIIPSTVYQPVFL